MKKVEKLVQRQKTNQLGVYRRTSDARPHFNGKPDLCFEITYKKEGKQIREKVGWLSEGYSVALASQIRTERLRSIRHGEELPREKKKVPFFEDVAEIYFRWAVDNLTKGGKFERNRYDNHLKGVFNGKRLNEIGATDLEELKSILFKKTLSPATVKHCLVLFRSIFNKAVDWDLYDGPNPIKKVKMPVLQNERERFLTREEATILLAQLKERSPLWHDITLVALQTGMRASEIFSLRGHDLDFDQELINIDDTKNKHTRKAEMPPDVKTVLLQRRPETIGDLVFISRTGGQITEVSRTFDRIVDEIGFNQGITDTRHKVVFHTMRHTFASWLAIQGTPLHVIAKLTGHRQFSMVQRYSHLLPDVKRRAVRDAFA